MKHEMIPTTNPNVAIDRNDPENAKTAIELEWPETFSRRAKMAIKYFEDTMFVFFYKNHILKGPFFICGLCFDDFASISDGLAEKYTEKFYWPEVFVRFGNHVVWFKDQPGARPQMLF